MSKPESSSEHPGAPASPARVGDEIRRMQAEPLLRAEKVMIGVSLALGVLLLAGFLVLSHLIPASR